MKDQLPIAFFGSLRDADLFEIVVGKPLCDYEHHQGCIHDYQLNTALKQAYPVLIPQKGAQIEALIVWGLTAEDIVRLQFYETVEYQLGDIEVVIEGDKNPALCFQAIIENIQASDKKWSFTLWQQETKHFALKEAEIAMAYCGKLSHQEIEDMWPEIERQVKESFITHSKS